LFLACQSATFVDNSTNNFAVTVNGNSVPRQFNPFGWTSTTGSNAAYSATNYGGSMYFDGSGDHLVVPSNATLGMGTGDFTIECWYYHLNRASTDGLLCVGTNNLNIFINTSGTLGYFNGSAAQNTSQTVPLNAWGHIALVRSSGTVKMYYNGVEVLSQSNTTNFATTSWFIGTNGAADNDPANGYMSSARIVKGQAVYTSNFAPPVAPLAFNANAVLQVNGTGAAIYDSSMITTYETLGNASTTGVIKKYGNSSLYFDGTGDYLTTPVLIAPQLFQSTRDWTIEFWFNTSSSGTMGIIDTYYVNSPPYSGLIVQLINGTISVYDGGSNRATTATYNNGAWHYFAWTNASGTSRVFINGTNVTIGGVTSWTTSSNVYRASVPLQIGRDFSSNHFNGYLDDLRITQGVARYTSNFTPPTSPFIQN
jgi:hypothetical protein